MFYKFLILLNISEEFKDYIRLLIDIRNPVFISFVIVIIILIVLQITFKYLVIPQQRKHRYSERKLQLQNMKLMAIFADLDPDPVIRVDLTGKIIFLNPAAKNCMFEDLLGENIHKVFPSISLNIKDFIRENSKCDFYEAIKGRYYSIQICGIGSLKLAQAYLHDITELKQYQEGLERSQSELKNFSRSLQKKIESERQRISRELHDGVGQNLLLLKINLQKRMYESTGKENSPEYLDCADLIEKISRDLKGISYSLKPRILEEMGLIPALISLVENVKSSSGIEGNVDFIDVSSRLNPELETSIYRIVQEALNNVLKYSSAKEFNIQIINKNNSIKLIITDDGIGFNMESIKYAEGMGIRNMKERSELHNGTFRINSSKEDGTVIVAEFPLRQE